MECRFLFFSLLSFFFFSCRESSRLSSGIQKYNKKQRKADGMRGTARAPVVYRYISVRDSSASLRRIRLRFFHSLFIRFSPRNFLNKGREGKIRFSFERFIQIVFPRDRFIRKILPNVGKVTRSSEF